MKTCTKCSSTKLLDDFYKRNRSPDGREAMCKVCRLEHNRKWHSANKDRHRELTQKWYAENKEQHLANSKVWYESNKHRKLETTTAREKRCVLATPTWADRELIKELYELARKLTNQTGIPHEVDHVVPLQGKNVSGLHCPDNLQVITQEENRRKANKLVGLD